ncbi:MAG: helix-turn-helix domain-containing protein [Prevotella sp.]|uniref:AraC family transcriptional regulator n=1 Tax=Prevotella sp. TaxID=59823 RepID=UPI002A2EE69E|nr:helix-turn-helix domain-containing protein [Prevotella sp.]MDD7318575.1 helix-turn-helix domain-containing protein [Prevotellaceae bacterium]MDY4020376.1 helix-turn-helix domain-containing protein [Prevotella sp.]
MDIKNINSITIENARKIYHGSHIDNELLLIDDMGDLPLPNEPRRMKCLLLGLCTHGKAQYSVDTEEHLVKAGDVIIINEGTVTDNYMLSPDCKGVCILLSYDFFRETIKGMHELSQLFLFSRTHPVFSLSQEEVTTMMAHLKVIKCKIDAPGHHFRADVVRALMLAMVYDISNVIYRIQAAGDKRQTRAEAIFASFIKLVENNFRHERRVGWYGEQLCITPKYLSETVKLVSKRTPIEWIDNYVTLEMRVLLRNTNMSIKEIAQELHFPNQSFLGKFFKEHVGMSPSDYRKS